MGLRFGGFIVWRGVLCARALLNVCVNPLMRTLTLQHARGRRCPRADHRVHVRVIGPVCTQDGAQLRLCLTTVFVSCPVRSPQRVM